MSIKLSRQKPLITGKICTFILNVGDCGKCGLAFNSFILRMADKGIRNFSLTNNPEDCNCLIILGCVLTTQKENLIETWQKIKNPHIIINFGTCGTAEQKLFEVEEKNLVNRAIETEDLADLIPIDYKIPGCPPDKIEENIREILRLNF